MKRFLGIMMIVAALVILTALLATKVGTEKALKIMGIALVIWGLIWGGAHFIFEGKD